MKKDRPQEDQGILEQIREKAGTNRCVLCGKCAAVCPSFRNLNLEIHSPRGRMALCTAFLNGELEPGEKFLESLSGCFMCEACDAICPAGAAPFRAIVFLKTLAPFQGIHQELKKCLEQKGNSPLPIRLFECLNIRVSEKGSFFSGDAEPFSPKEGNKGKKVIYFPGCIRNYHLPDSAQATFQALKKMNCEISFAKEIECCGAPLLFTGSLKQVKEIAKRNLEILSQYKQSEIVCDCPTCAWMFKNYAEWFFKESPEREVAEQVSQRVKLFSEFLSENSSPDSPLFSRSYKGIKLGYLDSCIQKYGWNASGALERILSFFKGLETTEIPENLSCPGWGLLLVEYKGLSEKYANRLISFVEENHVEILVTEDSALQLYMRLHHPELKVLSISELLVRGKYNSSQK